ncbi:CSL4 Exosome complex component CSL4 [Candida maltosa Xu316]
MSEPSVKIAVPGQYIVPAYKLEDNRPVKYTPGKGTTLTNITNPNDSSKSIPVISSTILGRVNIQASVNNDKQAGNEDGKEIINYIVSVIPKNQSIQHHQNINDDNDEREGISINLPKENDIVLVKITKISNIQAYCEIISLESKPILSDSGLGSNGTIAHVSLPTGGGSQHLFNQQQIASSQSTPNNVQIHDLGENFKGIIRINDIRSTERDKIKIIDCFKPGDIVRAVIISLGDGTNYYLSTARNDLGVVFAKSENGAGGLMYPLDWQNMIDLQTGLIEKRKNANPFI